MGDRLAGWTELRTNEKEDEHLEKVISRLVYSGTRKKAVWRAPEIKGNPPGQQSPGLQATTFWPAVIMSVHVQVFRPFSRHDRYITWLLVTVFFC